MADRTRKTIDRRRFLKQATTSAIGVTVLMSGLSTVSPVSQSHPAELLRPPGALPEPDFLAACIRCGQCVQACPYQTLRPAEIEDGAAPGTPVFEARHVACEMCEDIPCVRACPTGALDPKLKDITQAKMGVAVLVDPENCLNMQGLRCDVCYRNCPVSGSAITLEMFHNRRTGRHAIFVPTVNAEACTGCGKCEQTCVLEEAAIKVLPLHLARGRLGRHYRFGWKASEGSHDR